LQSRQLMPTSKDSRSLRKILKDAGRGNSADQQEVNAAVGRTSMFLIPAFVFIFGLQLASALPLYWLVSSLFAYIQQSIILKEDAAEADASVGIDSPSDSETADKPTRKKPQNKKRASTKPKKKRKRRK